MHALDSVRQKQRQRRSAARGRRPAGAEKLCRLPLLAAGCRLPTSGEILEDARATAMSEGQRLVGDARQEAALEQARARDQLRQDVGRLAVAGASRLLEREVDPQAHADLIERLAREIETRGA
jgi:hypothetical protein